jgi:hypothetical protein
MNDTLTSAMSNWTGRPYGSDDPIPVQPTYCEFCETTRFTACPPCWDPHDTLVRWSAS